jgi:hypothetical protein
MTERELIDLNMIAEEATMNIALQLGTLHRQSPFGKS